MSSAIKPPGAAGSGGPTGPGSPEDVRAPGSGEAFQQELSNAERSHATAESSSSSSSAPSGAGGLTGARAELLRVLANEIRSGHVDPSQAVDRLIERALTTGPAASLPPARRVELEAQLRAALEEDPTLLAMQRDLTRGR